MKISNLLFEFRIKSKPSKTGTFKVSHIRQKGDLRQGWGLANKKGPKIYILKINKEIAYIGITRQPLSNRFRYGLSATGENGYHGYAWKELANSGESEPIDLFIYRFDDEKRTEAIEAEIVYLVRNKTGKWPKYQTEIHFHQANAEEINTAKQIYKQISILK